MSRHIISSKKNYTVLLLNLNTSLKELNKRKKKEKRSLVIAFFVQLVLSINEPCDVERIYDAQSYVYKTRCKQQYYQTCVYIHRYAQRCNRKR